MPGNKNREHPVIQFNTDLVQSNDGLIDHSQEGGFSQEGTQELQSTTDLGSRKHSQGGNLPSQEGTQESRSRSIIEKETDNEKKLRNQWLSEISQHIPENIGTIMVIIEKIQ